MKQEVGNIVSKRKKFKVFLFSPYSLPDLQPALTCQLSLRITCPLTALAFLTSQSSWFPFPFLAPLFLIPIISALIKKEQDSRLWGPKEAKNKIGGTTPVK